jgi:FAD/FMN-containing dehydrogenase
LFNAVLAGVGQHGIIVRAKLKLVPAEESAIDLTLRYDDLDLFMDDMRTLMQREEFDMVWGGVMSDANGWFFELYTTSFYTAPNTPDIDFMLRDLSFVPDSRVEIDGTYFDYQTRVDGLVEFLRGLGVWDGFMHPWFDVFLPESEFVPYVGSVLPTLQPDDVGNFGFVLLFPMWRSTVTRPSFRLPDDDIVILFDVLTLANFPGYDAAYDERMRTRNRSLYEAARAIGGTRYPIGSLTFDSADWQDHYGEEWPRVVRAKRFFDPDHILAPGVGMFPS